jgi:uncharacterized protein YjdB
MKKIQFAIFICIFSAFIFASCDTNPRPNYGDDGLVTGVILSLDDLIIAPGENTTLTAAVLPADVPEKDRRVKWTSSNPNVAAVEAAGDDKGKITGIAAGQATITVTTLDDNFMAQCAVTVIASGSGTRVKGVSLPSDPLKIVYGESATLTAAVDPSNATDQRVKWMSSNPDIAAVHQDGTISATVSAKSGGEADITVSTVDGGHTASRTVTVTFPVSVSGVTLNLNKLDIAPGGSATLIAVVSPANATDKQVTWKSSNEAVATVSASGKVSITGKAAETAKITVTADGNKDATAECAVTVTSGGTPVEGVTLDKSAITLGKNESKTLTATVLPNNATNKAVKWISSNEAVAEVTGTGATVTVTGKAGGSAIITVSTENGGKTDTCDVTVNVPVSGVSLDHTKIMLRSSSGSSIISNNSKAQLSATVLPSDATNKNVTWSSNNTDIATVSASGMVTGKAAGTADITVTTADGGKTAKCAVTVYAYFVVTNESEWAGALSNISSAQDGSDGSPNVFVINITDSFSVNGISDSSIGGEHKEVRLTGNKTVSLSSSGSLIRTAAKQTFIIDGPTLQGNSDNDTSLVYIGDDGALELHNGKISGNNAANNGGAVYIDGGNFTMTGGKISGNTADGGGSGGGVYVTSGNFTMTGGEISGNNATGSSMSGGVYIESGIFTMTGGNISGNSANSGGGIVVSGGNFKMTGGGISGNNANNQGGGIFVSGGNFTMTGGEISGNSAGYNGGGVFVNDGNFSMTKGFIYGNDASDSLKNTATFGAAVYINPSGTPIDDTITQYP